jgi:hypothetical protein
MFSNIQPHYSELPRLVGGVIHLLLKKYGENMEEKPFQGGITERPYLAKRLRHG